MNQDLKVAKPALVKIGERAVSISGWSVKGVQEHLEWHLGQGPMDKWCEIKCLTRTMFGRDTGANRDRTRRRMRVAFRKLLIRDGLFLAIEYDADKHGHGKILGCKIFEPTQDSESQFVRSQLDGMVRRREITGELLERAKRVIGVEIQGLQ